MAIIKNHDPEVAKWVKQVREGSGMSQARFWKTLRISPSAGCRYENNQRTVPSTVKQLIEYRILGVSRPRVEKGFSKELLEALDLVRSNEVVWDYVKTLVKAEERAAPGLG